GVGNLVAIGLVDRRPLGRIAELLLRDLRKTVASLHRVGARSCSRRSGCISGRRRGAAALNVREVGARLVGRLWLGTRVLVAVVLVKDLVEQSHADLRRKCTPPRRGRSSTKA